MQNFSYYLVSKQGIKNITVKTEIYDYFYDEWLKVKEEYTISKSVRSFSAYVTHRLAQLMDEDKKNTTKRKALNPFPFIC